MPVQITNGFCDAGVPGEHGDDDCERVLYSLQIFDVGTGCQVQQSVRSCNNLCSLRLLR